MTSRISPRMPLWLALVTGFCAGFIAPVIIAIAQLALVVVSLILVMFTPQYASSWPDMGGAVYLMVPLLLCVVTVPAGLIIGFLTWVASRFLGWANFPSPVYLLLQLLLTAGAVFGLASLPLFWAVNLNWPFGGFYLLATGGFTLSVVVPLWLVNLFLLLVRRSRVRRSLRTLRPETVQTENIPA